MIVKYIASAFFFCLVFVSDGVAAKDFERIAINRVWTGTPAEFAGLDTGDTVYIAYYRPDRHMTVATYNKSTRALSYQELESVFKGWDAHNGLALGIDPEGRLHIAGNMHAAPLIYGRMTKPHDLGSLQLFNTMTSAEEESVTYPEFLHLADGRLLFMYRAGRSGQGRHYINAWDGTAWTRWIDAPLFAYNASSPESAYPTLPVRDTTGIWHMAWVWRTTPDAASNCCVSYARSPDLRHWEDAAGTIIPLPIEHGEGTPVDTVPARAGLLNNIKLALANGNTPVISYQKLDGEGYTQVYNAYLDGTSFQSVAATQWKTRWMPEGGGSLAPPIGYSGVMQTGEGTLWQQVSNKKEGFGGAVMLDTKTLAPLHILTPRQLHADPGIAPQLPPPVDGELPKGMRWVTTAVHKADGTPASGSYLRWPSYSANRDKPRECTDVLPDACHPPAEELMLLISE